VRRSRASFAAAALALFCATGCGAQGCSVGWGVEVDRPQSSSADADFTALRDRYFIAHLRFNPVESTYLGGDGYDASLARLNGALRDFSEMSIARELDFYRTTLAALGRIDRTRLSAALQIDYQLMNAQLSFLIREGDRKQYERAVETYVAEPFRGLDWQLQQMALPGDGQLGTEEEWNLVLSRLLAVPAYFATAREALSAGRKSGNLPDRRMVQRDGIDGLTADARYFRDDLQRNAIKGIGNRPFGAALLPKLKEAGNSAAAAAESFSTFLKATYDVKEDVDRFPAGVEEYEWRIRNVFRDARSASELYDYGNREIARYRARLVEVARRIADSANLRLSWERKDDQFQPVRAVFDYLSKDSPRNDEELFRWYREVTARAIAYGRERALFDVPQEYKLDIVPTPDLLQGTLIAAYYPAPPLKKSGVGRFYVTPSGNDPASLTLNNRSSVADTAVHEGFPGHDWHFKYMSQHASDISNIRWLTPGAVEDTSSMWGDSMATEGWGLYAEDLMAEPAGDQPYGFYTAGEYLYELQWQIWRAVRIRVDVGMHTGRMTFDQARDFFTEQIYFYPRACASKDAVAKAMCETADREIYRYSKWPTQAITYNLGKTAIVELREAVRAKQGPAFSARTFHQRLMGMGPLPAGYFREEFLK
jgi:uncharacterized protein (DUF885 family)